VNWQRQTRSSFVINLLIEADRAELLAADPKPVDMPRDDGSTQRIFHCATGQWRSSASTHTARFGSFTAARSLRPARATRFERFLSAEIHLRLAA
jgi:hypothetical protein